MPEGEDPILCFEREEGCLASSNMKLETHQHFYYLLSYMIIRSTSKQYLCKHGAKKG